MPRGAPFRRALSLPLALPLPIYDVVTETRHQAHPDRARLPDAERIHREFQQHLLRRVPGREMVRVAGAGPPDHCNMENRLQRDQTAQQLRAYAACDLRRFESPVNWRFKAREQDQCRNQLILQTTGLWNLDWHGDWGQVTPYLTMVD